VGAQPIEELTKRSSKKMTPQRDGGPVHHHDGGTVHHHDAGPLAVSPDVDAGPAWLPGWEQRHPVFDTTAPDGGTLVVFTVCGGRGNYGEGVCGPPGPPEPAWAVLLGIAGLFLVGALLAPAFRDVFGDLARGVGMTGWRGLVALWAFLRVRKALRPGDGPKDDWK
jgi:hypothetical protein